MSDNNSIKKNAIMNILYSMLNVVFPLITFPYVSRMLSTSGMGVYSFFSSFASYMIIVAAVGISTYGIRCVAVKRKDRDELSKVVCELLMLNLIVTVALIAGLGLLYFVVPQFYSNTVVFALYMIYILSAPFALEWFFAGVEQYDYITKRSFAFKIISLILIFIMVKSADDFIDYIVIMVFSYVISNIVNFCFALRFIKLKTVAIKGLKKHIKPMLILFASSLAINVYTNLDATMLGFISDNTQVAYYAMAVKIKSILLMVVNSLSAVLLPRLSYYIDNGNTVQYQNILKKSVVLVLMMVLPITTFCMVRSEACVVLLGGEQYSQAAVLLTLIMPVLIFSGISNITGNQILLPHNKEKYFMRAVVVGALADLILNIMFISEYGALGAVIATLMAEFIQMSIQIYYSRKIVNYIVDVKGVCQIAGATVTALILLGIMRIIGIDTGGNLVLNLIIDGIVYFASYVLILAAMNNESMCGMIKSILHIDIIKKNDSNVISGVQNNGIDLCKLIMAVVVVAIHTEPLVNCDNEVVLMIYNQFIQFAVPFFFIATGYFLFLSISKCCDVSKKRSIVISYIKKTAKMYVLWSLIYLPIEIYFNIGNGTDWLKAIIRYVGKFFLIGSQDNSWQMWYLLALLYALIVILLILKHISKLGLPMIVVSGMCTVLCQELVSESIGRMFSGLLYVLIGMYIAKKSFSILLSTLIFLYVNIYGLLVADRWVDSIVVILGATMMFMMVSGLNLKEHRCYIIFRKVSANIFFVHMLVWTVYSTLLYGERIKGLESFVITVFLSVVISSGMLLVSYYCSNHRQSSL